jgi:hypothetical protein
MMACASGGWRAISSSAISGDMPSCCGKERTWPVRLPNASPRAVADYNRRRACRRLLRPQRQSLRDDRLRADRRRHLRGGYGAAFAIAPKSAFGIRVRNLIVRVMRRLQFVADFFIGRELRDQVELPDYGFWQERDRNGEIKSGQSSSPSQKGATLLLASVQSTCARRPKCPAR